MNFTIYFNAIPNSVTPIPTTIFTATNYSYGNLDYATGFGNTSSFKVTSMPKGIMPFQINSFYNCYGGIFYPGDPYCYSHQPLNISTDTDIRTATINNSYVPTSEDFLFQNIIFKTSEDLTLTLAFYQADGEKYANSFISVNMLPIQVPPTMAIYIDPSLDDSEKMSIFFTMNTTSNYTNSEGEVNVSLAFNGSYFGFWAATFTAGSASTYPLFFRTEFPVGSMQIKRQPAVNASVPHVADVFMTVPQVTVSDLAGVPLPFVVVTVLFDDGSGCNNGTTIAMLDQYTYGCASNTQLTSFVTTFYSYKAKTFNTDEYGILTLDSFGLMDVAGKACVRFRFAIGEPGMVFISAATDEVCLINDYVYDVSDAISYKVADNQPFSLPATVTFKRDNAGQYDTSGFIIIAGFAKYIDSEEQSDLEDASERVLLYNYCQFYNATSIDGYCTDLKIINDDKPFIASTNFTSLQWRRPTLSSTFQLQFSSVLLQDSNAISSPIEVVSTPSNLDVLFILNLI